MSRLSQQPTLTTVSSDDLIPIVDVSDTTASVDGTTKIVSVADLVGRGHPKMGGTGRGIPTHLSVQSSSTTTAFVADRINYFPILIEGNVTINDIWCEVTTLSSGSMYVGIYEAEVASGIVYPTSLVQDFGTVSTGSTGIKNITGLTCVLTPGYYAIAWLTQAAPTLRVISHLMLDSAVMANSGSSNVAQLVMNAYRNQAYGSLPGTFPTGPPTYNITASGGSGWWCPIWLGWTL